MLVNQIPTLKGKLPGLGVPRALSGEVGLLAFGQLDLESRDDLLGNIVLQDEYIADFPVITLGPEVTACRGFDQLRCHAHPLAAAAHTAFQHVLDTLFTANLSDIDGPALVDQSGIAGDDKQLRDFG